MSDHSAQPLLRAEEGDLGDVAGSPFPSGRGAGEVGHSALALGILVSGRGTNLVAIQAAIERGEVPARIAVVASNRPEAPALDWARASGLPVAVFARLDYPSRAAAQDAMIAHLQQAGVELVVLAGWDQVLTDRFVATFEGRLLNVHPSLLPA